MNRTVLVIQARMGSSRLPGKVLAPLGKMPLLGWVVAAARSVKGVDQVVVATSTDVRDRAILECARQLGVEGFAGNESDVLDRYYAVARTFKAQVIMRMTADCPLADPWVSTSILGRFRQGDADYVSNCHPPTYPDGLDTEVFSFQALEQAWSQAKLPSEREHVTPYIWKHPEIFRLVSVCHPVDYSYLRWTVDEPEDLEFVRAVCDRLTPALPPYRMEQILHVARQFPELSQINSKYLRNESYVKSVQQDQQIGKQEGNL